MTSESIKSLKAQKASKKKAPKRSKKIFTKQALSPYWVVGFVDGDGCFSVRKTHNNTSIRLNFVVSQHKRSVHVLLLLQAFFGCGIVIKSGGEMMEYNVGNTADLKSVIVPFFKQHPLQTKKYWDFQVLSQVLEDARASTTTMEHVNHLKERMGFTIAPHPISQTLSNTDEEMSAPRYASPLASHSNPSLNLEWLAGFIDADGSFVISMSYDCPKPQLVIGMHKRETELATRLQAFLGLGCFYKRKDGFLIYQISSISDHQKFLERFVGVQSHQIPLRTKKRLDFFKFRRIVQLMVEKKHKTPEGILIIKKLKALMNSESYGGATAPPIDGGAIAPHFDRLDLPLVEEKVRST